MLRVRIRVRVRVRVRISVSVGKTRQSTFLIFSIKQTIRSNDFRFPKGYMTQDKT
jgi:hypothetical protein